MFFKRFLVLSAGVLLFVLFFISYFAYNRAEMENRFREARTQYGVENAILTTNETVAPTPPTAAPEPAPTPVANTPPAPAPSTEATNAAPDPLIGPVPPQPPDGGPAPDTNPPTAAPVPPDPSAAPMAPTPSTYNEPLEGESPFQLAGYRPGDGFQLQAPEAPAGGVSAPTSAPAPPVSSPSTNTPPTPAEAATGESAAAASTNETSIPAGTPLRAAPVQASVIILGYHQFMAKGESSKNIYKMRADVFESEMKYLRDNGYHVVPLSDVVKFLKGEIGLPPNSVAITIDDGFKSAIVYAAPILKKYGYPWTFFCYPAFITNTESKGAASWADLLALQKDGVDIESHSMTHPFPGLTHKMQPLLASFPQEYSAEAYSKFLAAETEALKPTAKKHLLTPEEYDQFLTNETLGAKAILEKKLGKTISYLAYPYGDYNKQVEAKALEAGYEGIFTVASNPVHSTTKLSSVGRYIITQPVEKAFGAYLRQGALGIAEAEPPIGGTTSNPRPVISAVIGYAGNLDAKSIEAEVRDFGYVKHDFDPKTSTLRLYLPRDLVQSTVIVNVRVKDPETGQNLVANWRFNYEPAGKGEAPHAPIGTTTNAAPVTEPVPQETEKKDKEPEVKKATEPETKKPTAKKAD